MLVCIHAKSDELILVQRRCVHDEYGRVDPAKAAEPSKPRGSSSSKRPMRLSDEHVSKKFKSEYSSHEDDYAVYSQPHSEIDAMIDPALLGYAQQSSLESRYLQQPLTDVGALSMPPQRMSEQDSRATANGYMTQWTDPQHAAMIAAQAQQILVDPQMQQPLLSTLRTDTNGTPEHDKSFSPITTETVSADTPTASGAPQVDGQARSDRRSTSDSPHDTGPDATPADEHNEHDNFPRRRSSLTATTSPKQEVTSSESRRSSSQTSRATNPENAQYAVVSSIEKPLPHQNEGETSKANGEEDEATEAELQTELTLPSNPENTVADEAERIKRSGTAASRSSEHDEDEKMARELQAQEHGLRRRTGSLRTS